MKVICWNLVLACVAVSVIADSSLLNQLNSHQEVNTPLSIMDNVQSFHQPLNQVNDRFFDDNVKYSDVMQFLTSWKSEENIKRIVVCENSHHEVASCPAGEMIYVKDGFFGRDDVTTCPRFNQPIQTKRCISPLSLTKLMESCNYKNTCLLQPLASIFGDSCIGTPKYIKMTYYCLPRRIDELRLWKTQNVETSTPIFVTEKQQKNVLTRSLQESEVLLDKVIAELMSTRVPNQLEDTKLTKPLRQDQMTLEKQLFMGELWRHHKSIQEVGDKDFLQEKGNPKIQELRERQLVKHRLTSQFSPKVKQNKSPLERVVCENETYAVQCPVNQVIKVIDGYFGLDHDTTCRRDITLPFPMTCTNPNSLSILKSLCQDQNECTLKASHSVFGYYCMNMQSYLKMTYECVRTV